MDKSICFTICPIGFIAWVIVMFLAAFWNYAAHDKVKEFEEYHGLNGYRYSTKNGNSVEKETGARSELGL